MNAIEFNKIAGAVLFALLAMFGARTVSNLVFHPVVPEKPGYVIATGEDDGAAGGGVAANDGKPQPTLAQNLSVADAGKGERVAKKCAGCHTFNSGGPSRVGPNLYGIVGRKAGSVSGYAFSSALSAKGQWGFEELDAYIADPKGYAPGTKMAFAGIKNGNQRADLIVYLRNLSSSPLPLPSAKPIQPAPEKAAADDAGSDGDAVADPEPKSATQKGGEPEQPAASDPDPTGSIDAAEPPEPATILPLPDRNTKRERPQKSSSAEAR